MAVFAIPNPTKNLKVNFTLSETRKAVKNISRLNSKYSKENFNETIENYKFSASETLNLGCYVDINLSEIETNKTGIDITISRKIGSFDKSFEITKANKEFIPKTKSGFVHPFQPFTSIIHIKTALMTKHQPAIKIT